MVLDHEVIAFMDGANGSRSEEEALFCKIFEIYESDDPRYFMIWGIYNGDQLCGHFELKDSIHTSENELEIVYIVHPRYRKRGIMTEILAWFKRNQHQWNKRFIATLSPENISSLKLLEKWGIYKMISQSSEDEVRFFKVYLEK